MSNSTHPIRSIYFTFTTTVIVRKFHRQDQLVNERASFAVSLGMNEPPQFSSPNNLFTMPQTKDHQLLIVNPLTPAHGHIRVPVAGHKFYIAVSDPIPTQHTPDLQRVV